MTENMENNEKRRFGYGASYRRGNQQDLGKESEIGAVFGGQVWMFKPDKEAKIEHPCIWMQAGVVKYKNCNNFYDCNTCKYDLGMMKQVEKGRQSHGQDRGTSRSA